MKPIGPKNRDKNKGEKRGRGRAIKNKTEKMGKRQ
jgi:hypothetical protein